MRQILCAVFLLGLLITGFSSAGENSTPVGSFVPQARVDPALVRVRVIDGDDIRFLRISGVEGLSQNRVTQISQDNQGFMWFATQYGVDRYDGYQFKVFKINPAQSNSPCGVFTLSLLKDRSGSLWVGCEYGLDRFEPSTETFIHYPIASGPIAHLSNAVRHIYQDTTGMWWLSTGNGLVRVDSHSHKPTWFHHIVDDPFSLSSDDVKSSGEDRQGVFWVANSEGVDAFDRNTGHVTFHVPLHEAHELSFYEDRDGVFWILSASGNGLAILDRKQGRLARYSFASEDLAGLPLTGATQMLEDREGNLWVGTLSDGLLRFDRENTRFVRYRHDPSNPDSIPEDRITSLFEDREGNIWVGLGATRPTFFSPRPSPFKRLSFDPGNRANLGEKLVNVIFQDRGGVLWIGTTGALNRCDSSGKQCTHYTVPGNGITSDILSIIEDRSGNLWVGTSGQGLCRFEKTLGRCQMLRHANGDASSVSNDTISRLLIDSKGVLWVGTGDGLNKFDPITQRFTVYRDESSANSGTQVLSITEDEDGNLWLGSFGSGLLRLDRETGHLEAVGGPVALVALGSPKGGLATISNQYVGAVFIDHARRLWAGTGNGLDRIDPLTGRTTRYSEASGLPSSAIGCILEDASGHLWLSTSKGLSKFNPETGTSTNFTFADGLPGDLTTYSACFKSVNGEMFFGGFAGATRFRPEEVSDDSYSAPVVLTAFALFGAPLSVGPESPLKRVIGFTEELTLAHNQNSFSFQFSTLSFRSPSTNRYRYKLEGLDQNWHEVGSDQRYASYTTLPAGKYWFRVQGATIRGPWSEPGVAVRISITPAWWATWWSRTFFGIAAILTMLALYLLRVRQLQRQFETQLEARESERTRVARELHDTLLQSLQGLLLRFQVVYELLPARPSEAKQDMRIAIDRTVRAIEEGRGAVQGLRTGSVDGDDLAVAIKTLAQQLTSDRSADAVVVRVDLQGTSRPLRPIVRDEIYQIGGEALRNCLRHAHASEVEVEIRYDEWQLRLRVRDNGKGIDPKFLGDEGAAGHFGLRGMRERAELIGGKLTIWTAAATGTEVELTVPAARAYAAAASRRFAWLPSRFLEMISDSVHE